DATLRDLEEVECGARLPRGLNPRPLAAHGQEVAAASEQFTSAGAHPPIRGPTDPYSPASLEQPAPRLFNDGVTPCASITAKQGYGRQYDSASGRVLIHCDVDSFYCAVEMMDFPELAGRPMAVRQFNAGGFVAVSYEAQACGVRKGDGVGDAGRASIPKLQEIGAVSLEEAQRRCPNLQVRPMRADRYREVASMIHKLLRRWSPQVEKTSYDDFYLDVTERCGVEGALPPSPPEGLCIVSGASWEGVPGPLRQAAHLAHQMMRTLQTEMKMTMSCGVSHKKLLARLVGPLNKPNKITLLPPSAMEEFLQSCPIRKVPNLQGKFGGEVEAQLAISTVGDLRHVDAALLHRTFGARQAAFLLELAAGGGDDSVLERGPPQSLLSERSFPPARTRTVVLAALRPLCEALCTRLRQDAAEHRRSPLKLSLTWRQGYGSNPRSKTAPFPAAATAALRRDAGAAVSTAEEVPEMLLKGAMALLEGAVDVPWELTRLAVGAVFPTPATPQQLSSKQQLPPRAAGAGPSSGARPPGSQRAVLQAPIGSFLRPSPPAGPSPPPPPPSDATHSSAANQHRGGAPPSGTLAAAWRSASSPSSGPALPAPPADLRTLFAAQAETQGSQVSAGPRAASPRPQGGAASSHHPAARSGGDRSIHAMFTTFASARPSIEPAATAAAAVERPSATEARQSSGAVCGECGVWVAAGARVEHEDHHLAMRLQREEREMHTGGAHLGASENVGAGFGASRVQQSGRQSKEERSSTKRKGGHLLDKYMTSDSRKLQ
ncbi:hypothetical protein CYMTET_31418, partial [Cymbomonas tetramitiformis]